MFIDTAPLTVDQISRLFKLALTCDSPLAMRWYAKARGESKWVQTTDLEDSLVGTQEFQVVTKSEAQWRILLINKRPVPVNWSIDSLIEINPDAADILSETATTYVWRGHGNQYLKPFAHGQFESVATRDLYVDLVTAVNAEYGAHICLDEYFMQMDELSCLEKKATHQNVGHLIYSFQNEIAGRIFAATGKPIGLWTLDYSSNGYRALDWTGGGLSDYLSRLTGNEKLNFVAYEERTAAFFRILLGKFNRIRVHIALGSRSLIQDIQTIAAEVTQLAEADQQRIDYFFYAEARGECDNILTVPNEPDRTRLEVGIATLLTELGIS